ncbi:MAG TPA: YceI family protein [Sulfuricella sp.]|nr:YceI family protein [Sulfuricella sp.]
MIRLFAAFALLAFGAANAAEFGAVQFDKSTLAFVSKQMGVPVEGTFRKFAAQIRIDPTKPEAGRARVEIDLAGVDAGSAEADDEVKGKNWFNVREFPKASFVSSSVKALGGGRFEASGKMTLKGKTIEMRAPFTLKQEKDALILDGTFPLKRLDYGIGSGVWGDTSVVADEVQVRFHFILK